VGFLAKYRHRPDAALYREDWSPKPAGEAWEDLVFDHWWTDERGKTDDGGTLGGGGQMVTVKVD